VRIVEYKAIVTQKSRKSMRVQKHPSPFPLGRPRSSTGRRIRLWGTGWGNRRPCGLGTHRVELEAPPKKVVVVAVLTVFPVGNKSLSSKNTPTVGSTRMEGRAKSPENKPIVLWTNTRVVQFLSKINPRTFSGRSDKPPVLCNKSDKPPVCGKNPINPL